MDHALKGQPPPKRKTRRELLRTHESHLEMQMPGQRRPRAVKQPLLSEAYPASTQSIRKLEIMPLERLRVETRHLGHGVVVKTISAPYVGAAVVSVVEDEKGSADKIAIYNHSGSSILSSVPEGCILAVKEPYYRFNGEKDDYMICVDHPSDVLLLRFDDPIIPAALRRGVEKVILKSTQEWRSAGDQAFLERDLPTAIFCYTEALVAVSLEGDDSVKAEILVKRASTNLVLGRYDAAREDALASRTGAHTDWKSYSAAGRAAYGLCDYKASRMYFESAMEFSADGRGLKTEYERCTARLREEEEGCFDFSGMLEAISPQQVHVDSASYFGATYIAESTFHGRGIFASRTLRAGELVLCEKAAFMPNQYDPPKASAALYATMVGQLLDNPSLGESVLKLHGGDYQRSGKEGVIVDGVPVIDAYLVESIRLKNCFSSPLSTLEDTRPRTKPGQAAKGLWTYASHINHACAANAMRSFIGDMLILRATRDITKGEEIFHQYVPVKANRALRQAQFLRGWGFECGCALCEGEATSSGASFEKRTKILTQIEKIANKRPPNGPKGVAPDAAVRTVDRLAKQLEDAHEPEVYERLPRLMLIYPTIWLLEAHRGHRNHAKVAAYALKLLRNFGFFLAKEDALAGDPREMFRRGEVACLMTIHVVSALKYAAEACRAMRQLGMAAWYDEAGRLGYMMVTGFENELGLLDE